MTYKDIAYRWIQYGPERYFFLPLKSKYGLLGVNSLGYTVDYYYDPIDDTGQYWTEHELKLYDGKMDMPSDAKQQLIKDMFRLGNPKGV
jgi:hypothetical protein